MRSGVFNVSFEQLSLTALVFPLLSLRLQQSLIFNLSNKRPKKKKKLFSYQISTSVERSGKQLPSKASFSAFLPVIALILG